jgi:ABC-type antimicrobial peptide transport system permease subunit
MIAAFILLIACINFINLETAQAIYRAKEVGIRKTLGSRRAELIRQFLSETLLLTFFAVLYSFFFTKGLLYYFQDMIPKGVSLNLFSGSTLIFLITITAVVGICAGFYPAIVLSAFSPLKAIRNQMGTWKGQIRSTFLRKNLTVVQFTLSQVFIFATLVIGEQIQHMLSADMGFDKDAIMHVRAPGKTEENKKLLFSQRLGQMPQINGVSLSNSTPASGSMWTSGVDFASPTGNVSYNVQQKLGDTTFLRLYNIPLLAGRNVDVHGEETIINETFRKLLGFKTPEDALQKTVYMDKNPITIVGVMNDFYMRPVNEAVMPAMYRYNVDNSSIVNIKLNSRNKKAGEVKQTLVSLENLWKEQFPEEPFTYTFIDETINTFYQTEHNILKLLKMATGIAILISCLGLLGLSAFTISQRTREIGIRKVLGASLANIVILISRDFLKLILIAFVFAAPIAWILLSKWLEDFNYRIQLQWWMFALVGILALIAAILTVSYQTIKAALANPVKSLRSE